MTSKEFNYAIQSLMDFDAKHFFDKNFIYYPAMQRQMLKLTILTGASIIHGLPATRSQVELYYDTINMLENYIDNDDILNTIESYNKTFDKMLIYIDGK